MLKKIIQRIKETEVKEQNFERRYPLKKVKVFKKKEDFKKIFLAQGEKNLELMQKIPNRVKSMAYFDEIWKSEKRIKEIEDFRKAGGKIIGIFCNFVPEELIYAAGCLPIRICAGFYETIEIAEEILAKDICPLIKSSLGFRLAGLPYFSLCDLVIIPVSCDGKKKLGEILSDYLEVWFLELPASKDRLQSKEFWFKEIKILKKKLEKLSGNEVTFVKLKRAIELCHLRQVVFRRFDEIRQSTNPLISGRDALLVTQMSFFDDLERWTEKTEKLCQELNENREKSLAICPTQTPRLLFTGSPIIWPNYKFLNIVEEFGGIVAGDTFCSGTQYLYNPVEIDEWVMEEMLEAIAERYLLPSICPCFTESNDRIDNLFQMIKDFKIDGVIYHQLRLCQLYDIEFYKVKQVLGQKNVPLLRIQTDYSQEDVEQIKTRVEAFLEMIKGKKHEPFQ